MANHTTVKKNLAAGDKASKTRSIGRMNYALLSLWPCFVKTKIASKCLSNVKGYRSSEGLTAILTGMVKKPLDKFQDLFLQP